MNQKKYEQQKIEDMRKHLWFVYNKFLHNWESYGRDADLINAEKALEEYYKLPAPVSFWQKIFEKER